MNSFSLTLLDNHGNQQFDNVVQFIGADVTGNFGILAGHRHYVTVLRYGLARFCDQDSMWRYLALPGGVLRFLDNHLTISTVRYFLGDNRALICDQLAEEMTRTDSEVHSARATLTEIERSLVRRLAELSHYRSGGL